VYGGIRPGAADHPATTGRPRDRKPAATPGVALRGRTGGSGGTGATGPAPAARRAPAPRRARETNDVGLPPLDDELWRVDQPGDEPAYRAINLRRGT